MPKPRIVAFTKLFWPEGSGAELATYLIVKDILSKYFNVVVVTGTEKSKADILRCCRHIYWSILKTKYKPAEWLKLLVNTKTIRKLTERADMVYISSHTLLPLAIIAKLIKLEIKVVLHLHNYQPLTYTSIVLAGREPDLATDIIVEYSGHGSLLRALASGVGHYVNEVNTLSLHFADKLVCVSRRQYEILTKYIPTIRSKAVVVYNPPPPVPDIDKKLSDYPTILFSGGGSFIKGCHLAVKAFTKILSQHNCRIYFISGYSSSQQQRFLERYTSKFHGKLIALDRLPHEKLMALHRHVWAIVFPSICEEPLPYSIAESCLLGTIPVASRVGGVPEIVEGTYAEKLLFRPGDVEDFIEKIENVLVLSKEELMDISIELKEKAQKRFNAERIRDCLSRVFLSLVKG